MSPNQGFDVGKLLSGLLGGKSGTGSPESGQGEQGAQSGQTGQTGQGGQAGAPSGLGGMLSGLMGGGGGGGGALAKLMPALTGMLAGGGLQKMMGQLHQGGLGDQAKSWVSADAANQPVSPEQITQALGPDAVNQVAASSGLSQEQAAQAMATALPSMVNAVTPDGQVPQHVEVPDTQTMHSQINAFLGQGAQQDAASSSGTPGGTEQQQR